MPDEDVLPFAPVASAPPESVAEQQYTPLYPSLPNAETFRLTELSKIEKQISDELF